MHSRQGDSRWEVASGLVADAYFPHRLNPLARGATANTRVDSVDLGPLRIARISWGAEVSVRSEHRGAYAINIPMSGYLESRTGSHHTVSTPGMGTICPADVPTSITRWSDTCSILGIRIERDYLHRELRKSLDDPSASLPSQIDLTTPNGSSWIALVQDLRERVCNGAGVWDTRLVAEQLSGALTSGFILAAVPGSAQDVHPAQPRIIKRVLDAMEADPARAWTAADMADAAGVSIRRLQVGFREYLGCSPRDALVDLRLRRVRADLRSSDTDSTIAEVAMRWGFTHTGRFAATYRRKYGLAPSDEYRLRR